MSGRKQILAVDDMAVSLAAIETTLRDMYEVITVNSGLRALRYLDNERPDLILLDIKMANIDGIETLREIRSMKNGKDVPVIMLTSAQDKKLIFASAKLGIYDYVLKPFDQNDLRKRVRTVLQKVENERKEQEEQKAKEEDSGSGNEVTSIFEL